MVRVRVDNCEAYAVGSPGTTIKEIVLSGCSAGGMACYVKCDYVADYFAKIDKTIQVKCICDAGMFLDVETITGAGSVMRKCDVSNHPNSACLY